MVGARSGRWVWAVVGLLACSSVACSQEPTEPDPEERSSAAAPSTSSPTGPPTSAPPSSAPGDGATVRDARPLREVAEVIAEWPLLENGTRTVFRALRGNELLVNQFDDSVGQSLGLAVRTIADPRSDTPVAGHEGAQEGVLSADLDQQAVVWMESPSTELGVAPWVLYAADRRSGLTTRLSESGTVDGEAPPPVPGFTGPVLSGGTVYWAEVSGHVGAESVDIRACEVDQCTPRRVVRGAALPAVADGSLYFAAGGRYRGDPAASDYRLCRLDLGTGTTDVVRELDLGGATPTGLAAADDHVVVTVDAGEDGWVDVFDLEAGTALRIETDPLGSFVYPKVTPDFAVWAEGNSGADSSVGGYLLHFDSGEVYSVGNTAGLYNLEADGDTIVWQESSGPRPQDITTVIGRFS